MNAANTGVLTGYIVKAPERRGERGPYVMRVAVNGAGNTVKETGYFNIVLFADRFEKVMKYLTKGKRVSVSYGLRQSTWQTSEGQNRSSVELQAGDIQFISTGQSKEGSGGGECESSRTAEASGSGGEEGEGPWDSIDF